MNNSTTKN